jgi:cobalt/nickel transport system permease protein
MTLALDALPNLDSPLGRLDPRWKLAAFLLAVVAIVLLQTLAAATGALAGALLLAAVSRLPPRWLLVRLGGMALFLALFTVWLPFLLHDNGLIWKLGPLSVSWHGTRVALRLIVKTIAIVTLMLILLATAPLHVTLQAAYALRMPGLLVHLALLTYRYVFLLADEFSRLRIALRVRGYRNRANLHSYRTIGHVAGTLLVRGAERAERVGQAMRCRGFDGRFRSLAPFQTRLVDLVLFVLVVGSAAALLGWDFAGR